MRESLLLDTLTEATGGKGRREEDGDLFPTLSLMIWSRLSAKQGLTSCFPSTSITLGGESREIGRKGSGKGEKGDGKKRSGGQKLSHKTDSTSLAFPLPPTLPPAVPAPRCFLRHAELLR